MYPGKVCAPNIEAMNDTSVNADLLRTKKVGHPNIPQFEIRQYEPLILRTLFILQWCKGQEQPTDISPKVVVAARLAKPGPQALTKRSLFIERLTPCNTIEYPKIIRTQWNAMQPNRGAVLWKVVENILRKEIRPDRLVGKRTRVFFSSLLLQKP